MIAAIYTAHLYCDCAECEDRPEIGEYTGKSWSECAKSARKQGWRISQDRQRAFAPKHKLRRMYE